MLAIGDDLSLRAPAQKELLEKNASSTQQAALADAWWEAANTTSGFAKSFVQGRAAYWYRQALPGLSGLTKDKVEKRLAQVQTISREPIAPDSTVRKEVSTSPPVVKAPPALQWRRPYGHTWLSDHLERQRQGVLGVSSGRRGKPG